MRPRNYLPTKEVDDVVDDETCCHHSESACPVVVVVPQHMIPSSSSSSTTASGRADHGTFGSHPTTSRVWTHPSEQPPPPHRHDCGSKQHPTNSRTDTITTTTTTVSHPSIHARIPTNRSSSSSSSSSSRQGSHVLPPLVLDATASPSRTSRTSTHSSIPPSSRVMISSSSSSLVPIRPPPPLRPSSLQLPAMKVFPTPQSPQYHHHSTTARSGYLYKLGVQIPIYKRRFLTLPSSHPSLLLYYSISPHDTEPRGCLNIFNATIEADFNIDDDDNHHHIIQNDDESGTRTNVNRDVDDSNGTYRFAIVWKDLNAVDSTGTSTAAATSNTPPPQEQRVELEARSKQDAVQWIRTMERAQLSVLAQTRLQTQHTQLQSQREQITSLQQQLSQYKYMEQERDEAAQDAILYQQQLQQLDDRIGLLTRQMRPQPPAAAMARNDRSNDVDDANETKVNDTTNTTAECASNSSIINANSLQSDIHQVPGNHFAALHSMVEQLQAQVRTLTTEATTAGQTVATLNAQLQTAHHRQGQMEQHVCQIWEENCTLRKSMKQIKQEKRILVREIKLLRRDGPAAAAAWNIPSHVTSATTIGTTPTTSAIPLSSTSVSTNTRSPDESKNFTEEFLNASDEDKLIQELEDHVLSSIRLHEEYLSSVPMMTTSSRDDHIEKDQVSSSFCTSADTTNDDDDDPNEMSESDQQTQVPTLHPNVPLFEQQHSAPIVSLFDDDDEDEEDDDENNVEPNRDNRENHMIRTFGNTFAMDHDELETDITTPTTNAASKKATLIDDLDDEEDDMRDRPNPLLHLDDDDDDENEKLQQQCQNETFRAQNQPTYQLSCPLTDAISTTTNDSSNVYSIPNQVSSNDIIDSDSSQVYHITFYSRKIGIQFQKVPPTPIKAKGLLTEAMTDDLTTSTAGTTNGIAGMSHTTTAELRRIAAISMSSKGNHSNSQLHSNDTCDVATPVDAVLVCGFHGFDESNRTTNCPRPKLGARLVAFDGVSIEIGRWTFAAVRKAIQSCGRPLTLSFRNDYLTKEQRTILTKAVLDVDMASSSSHRPNKESFHDSVLTKLTTPRDSGYIHGKIDLKGPVPTGMTDDMSESAGGDSDYLHSFPQSFSGNRSVNSLAQYRSFYETRSYGSSSVGGGFGDHHKHNKIRSFSEAGGSATTTTTTSSVLSAIGPLVSNLLYRPRRPSEPFTPEYLRRAPEFVEETPQHQDFQSELL